MCKIIIFAIFFTLLFGFIYFSALKNFVLKLNKKYESENLICITKQSTLQVLLIMFILGLIFGRFILPHILSGELYSNLNIQTNAIAFLIVSVTVLKRISLTYVLYEKHIEKSYIFNIFNIFSHKKEFNYEDIQFANLHRVPFFNILELVLKDDTRHFDIYGFKNLEEVKEIIKEEASKYKLSYDP